VSPLRVAAEAAWDEAEGLWREVIHGLTLADVSPACRANLADVYAAYQRAYERAIAAEQLAQHTEGAYTPWRDVS
jgi:hypothetical protein